MHNEDKFLIDRGLPCSLGCNSSNAMAEYSDGWKCFSCGESKRKRVVERTVQSRIVKGLHDEQKYYDLPDKARAFLYKHHFTDELIEKYSICYAYDFQVWSTRKQAYFNSGDRLILPYTNCGVFEFLEARTLDPLNDLKYVTVGGKQQLFKTYLNISPGIVVLVEDLLSAMRVGEVCSAISLRGTSFNDKKLCDIVEAGHGDFAVWLDSDKPGQEAAKQLIKKLGWMGAKNIHVIVTDKDPKCYSESKIKNFIMESIN